LSTVFLTVFLAEPGDKTQLATLLFASREPASLWLVFFGASVALILSCAIGVAAGGTLAQYVQPKTLSYIAGGDSLRLESGRSGRREPLAAARRTPRFGTS
jgi:putative Ca2+/H+ antiporter (TMEM165/GDT1 family)